MSSLVAYGARSAPVIYRYNKRLRLASGMAKHIYNNRAGYGRAARTIGRAWKRSRRKRGKSYAARAAPSTKQSTRQYGSGIEATSASQISLQTQQIQFPDQTSGGRVGSTIKLSGVKCCYHLTNNYNHPVEVHWALIQEKEYSQLGPTQRFFRDVSDQTSRSRDFPSDPETGWTMLNVCQPINPDRFHIICHKRRILDGKAQTSGFLKDGRWLWKLDKYFSFKKKKLSFDAPGDQLPTKPLMVATWCQRISEDDTGNGSFGISSIDRVYFRGATN